MKPKLIVSRPIYPDVIERLKADFEVTAHQTDPEWTPQTWTQALSQHDGALTMGIETVNEEVLTACPRLRICANLSVGYNNFDVPAMTSLGVTARLEEQHRRHYFFRCIARERTTPCCHC